VARETPFFDEIRQRRLGGGAFPHSDSPILSEQIGAIQNQRTGSYVRANFEIGYRSDESLAKRGRRKFPNNSGAFERGATCRVIGRERLWRVRDDGSKSADISPSDFATPPRETVVCPKSVREFIDYVYRARAPETVFQGNHSCLGGRRPETMKMAAKNAIKT
jgi:hypothetical protein